MKYKMKGKLKINKKNTKKVQGNQEKAEKEDF